MSGALGALGGVLVTPITLTSYDVGIMLGLKGFVAAVVGGLGNGLGAVLGGLLVGVLEALGAGYVSSALQRRHPVCADLADAVLHAAGPVGRAIPSGCDHDDSRYLPWARWRQALLVLPWLLPNSFYLDLAIRMAINAIIVLGLNLLIGFAGQISLGHAGFLGLGAYASAVLPTHFGWPPLAAMLAGMALTGAGALVARPIFA